MSIDIDLYAYDYKQLVSKIVEHLKLDGTEKDLELIQNILERFGYITLDNKEYIILNNEWYEEGNPYFNICTVICSAFGKSEDKVDLFGNVFCTFKDVVKRKTLHNYVDKYETADDLGIDLIQDKGE